MVFAAQVLPHFINGQKGLLDFARGAADGQDIPPPEDLDAVSLFKRSEVLVVLTEEEECFLGTR